MMQDRRMGRVFDVFIKDRNQLWCGKCERTDCEHVDYAFAIGEVRDTLEKKGLGLPNA